MAKRSVVVMVLFIGLVGTWMAGCAQEDEDQKVERLIGELQDQDEDVRKHAASALGKIGSEKAVPDLIQALQDQNAVVRRAAVWALGKIGEEEAIPALIQALQDQDQHEHVRRNVARTLGGHRIKGGCPCSDTSIASARSGWQCS